MSTWQKAICQRFSVTEMLEQECTGLTPMPSVVDGSVELATTASKILAHKQKF